MKKILITGARSFIGTSFEKYMKQYDDEYIVDTLDMRNLQWLEYDFSKYDAIFHVAGIAHIRETKNNKELYFKINRDLAYKVATKAKSENVKQFILVSSMSVYGIKQGIITKETVLNPTNAYGISKMEAEFLVQQLETDFFKVTIVRPPMIYGKGCRGNYVLLSKAVKSSFVFPNIKNKKSMIYIDNFSYVIKYIIDNSKSGIYCPQNEELICTSNLAKEISIQNGKKVILSDFLGKIFIMLKTIDLIKKVFGDLYYDFYDFENLPISFKKSIELTEEKQ